MNLPRDPPRLLVFGLTIALVVAGVWAASTSVPAFGLYNPEWDGASELRNEAEAAGASPFVATQVGEYDAVSPNRTVAVVLSPDEPYTDAEATRLREFVQAGGTLVVAEDFGPHSNPLLERLGAEARIDGRLVRDEHHYYRSPNFSVATGVADSNLTGETDRLVLNHGTVIRPNNATVLVETSPFAYVDANGSATLDDTEEMRNYPVVTSEAVGDGRVVAVSDPSIFINAMSEQPGNQQFIQSLFSERPTVLLDYSHSGSVPPLVEATLALRRTPALQGLVGFVLVGAVALVSARLPAIRAHQRRLDRLAMWSWEDLRQRISRRDSDRRDKSMVGIMSEDTEENEDD